MKLFRLITLAIGMLALSPVAQALSLGGPGGWWPQDWPKELDPLRKQAWTWSHGRIHEGKAYNSFEITFKDREQFEAMWPHLLKLRPKEVPLTLKRGPHVRVLDTRPAKNKTAGIRLFTWSKAAGNPPAKVKPEQTDFSKTPGVYFKDCTLHAIELVIDGKIVDLNRIRLPEDAKIVDERFPNK
ncbi:MAG: hypothetical protein H8E27_09855 [Verrucomicrobia subdivision 3 bacterium]|nr:hypothetical protein [Limisphaerales bacterium]